MRFVNPLFLVALVAMAVPIIVHLFHFRRYKKVYFSNVALLREMQEETKRQSNLRRLLILVSRILAVLFLVLAFAQPYIPNKQSPRAENEAYVSVFLDNSFSMGGNDSYGMLLEHGKNKAREIVAAYKPTDNFQLMTNDLKGSQFRWLNKEEFFEAVDEVQVSASVRNLSEVMRRQYDFMHTASKGNHHAYLVTDFQKSVTHFESFAVDSAVSVTFVPLQASSMNNLYVDSIALNAPAFFVGGSVSLEVTVRNTGRNAVEGVPVRLFVGERQRAMSSIDVPAESYATANMVLPIEQNGILQCRVEIVDYPITFDDQFFFTINVTDRIQMLDIYGQEAPNPYLKRLFEDDSAIVYDAVRLQKIDFSTLGKHRFVVLDGVPSVSSGLSQTLVDFVQEGGSLLVVPSEKCDVNSYNNLLRKMQMPLLGKWVEHPYRASDVNASSRHFQNVFLGSLQDVEMPTVKGRYQVDQGTSVTEPIISFSDGSNLVGLTLFGKGKCFLVTSPLQLQYNDLVQQALFVPTFYNMALFSSPTPMFYSMIDSRQPVALGNTIVNLRDGGVKIQGGKVDFLPDVRTVGGSRLLFLHGEVEEAGNYVLKMEEKPVEGLSLNYSRQESEMQFYGAAEVEKKLKQYGFSDADVVKSDKGSLEQYIRKKNEGTQLFRYCAVLALLFLLVETLLIKIKPKEIETTLHTTH